MKVPLVDLRASAAAIREPLHAALEEILDGMQLFLGPNVQTFERDFAAFCGTAHGVGLSSGTDALLAACRALGIGPGDEVVVPSLTFFATVEAVVHAGATPVFVDVSPDTLTMDPERVAALLSPRTRALVPVHLYGHPADMEPLGQIAAEHRLALIEDAAQAHGARYRGRGCGSLADAACFSFYFTKNLGGLGEGGLLATDSAEVAAAARMLRDHGQAVKHEHRAMGYNHRLDEIQAAVLRLKLATLDAGNQRRREIARRYDRAFAGTRARVLGVRPGCEPVYHVYPLRLADRDELAAWLDQCGVGTGIHYPVPAHRQPALRDHPHRSAELPVTEQACRELLSIPMYPELTDEQVEYVTRSVLRFLDRSGGPGHAA